MRHGPARTASQHPQRHRVHKSPKRFDALSNCLIGVEQWTRALEVYELLAGQGGLHHRAARHPDLLIAAAAEAAGIPVLHYDEDYDRIAGITGQDVQWLAPRGTLR